MNTRPLAKKILTLVGGIIGLSSLAILLAVWFSTTRHAQVEVVDRLTVAQGVLQQALESNSNQLLNIASVLAVDTGFKELLTASDSGSVRARLEDHGKRVNADLVVLIDAKAKVLASTQERLSVGGAFPRSEQVLQALENGRAVAFLLVEERLYQLMLVTLDSPTSAAIVGVGLEMDRAFGEQFKAMTKLDVTFVVDKTLGNVSVSGEGGDAVVDNAFDTMQLQMSTLAPGDQLMALSRVVGDTPSFMQLFFHDYASRATTLFSAQSFTLHAVLSADLKDTFHSFKQLQYEIILIAALTFLSAFFVIAWWARAITQPLRDLAQWSTQVAAGRYGQDQIKISSDSTEVNDLILAFGDMQREIADREQKIRFQAQHDLLTQLLNRLSITDLIDRKLAANEQFQVVGISVVDFQGLNNVFGFQNGDKVLASLAARILRLGGQAARLNGGELLWIPESTHSFEQLVQVRERLDRPHVIGGLSMTAKTVVGELWAPRDGDSAEGLLRRASIVLDHAEQVEQRCMSYEASMEEDYLKRLEMIGQLKRALTTHQSEFSICYQPKVLAKSRQVLKAEALARWTNEKLGWVSPDQFIAIAEQSGLINVLTDCVINRVITDLKRWRAAGVNIQVAINLSVNDIMNPRLLPNIMTYLSDANLPTDSLSFEITESELMEKPEAALEQLAQFRQAGFSLAIDDFGTGYSSLAYLKSLPVTELKIDKSFVMKLDSDDDDQKIVQSIIALAKQFDLTLVAEGVENVVAMEMLEAWQCDWLQGFYLCRPLPAQEFFDWLSQYQGLDWARVS